MTKSNSECQSLEWELESLNFGSVSECGWWLRLDLPQSCLSFNVQEWKLVSAATIFFSFLEGGGGRSSTCEKYWITFKQLLHFPFSLIGFLRPTRSDKDLFHALTLYPNRNWLNINLSYPLCTPWTLMNVESSCQVFNYSLCKLLTKLFLSGKVSFVFVFVWIMNHYSTEEI